MNAGFGAVARLAVNLLSAMRKLADDAYLAGRLPRPSQQPSPSSRPNAPPYRPFVDDRPVPGYGLSPRSKTPSPSTLPSIPYMPRSFLAGSPIGTVPKAEPPSEPSAEYLRWQASPSRPLQVLPPDPSKYVMLPPDFARPPQVAQQPSPTPWQMIGSAPTRSFGEADLAGLVAQLDRLNQLPEAMAPGGETLALTQPVPPFPWNQRRSLYRRTRGR